jgi:hypothetical protein
MTFIHGYLLAGLVLAGVPVVLHLITRQKPKMLRFPAFRFLQQRHQRNRRRLRLRHLLLLLLRMGLIAGLCLALARPRILGGQWALSGERPVAAVLVVDTSPSMDFNVAGVSRLDEARRRARELLDEMPDGSQVAVLDSADDAAGGPDWLPPGTAPTRLAALRTRPANSPLNHAVERGFRLLAQLGDGEEVPPRFLYVFSDRTRASWDPALRPTRPPVVSGVWVDVGVEAPKDIAVEKVEVDPPAVTAGQTVRILVTVRATGSDFDSELFCRIDNDPDVNGPPDRLAIDPPLKAGQARVFVFERPAPARPAGSTSPAPMQVTVQVATSDALPFNNVRHATFLVRDHRPVLTIGVPESDREWPPWHGWRLALKHVGNFQCEARTMAQAGSMGPRAFQAYPVVCLFEVVPDESLWAKLAGYVSAGGGLVIVPGGDEWLASVAGINKDAANLLPAPFVARIHKVPPNGKAARWAAFSNRHPISGYFHNAIQAGDPDFGRLADWPSAYAWWATGPPAKDASVLAAFAGQESGAALLERAVGRGHVLQLTTPLDFRDLDANRRWHNYWSSSFGVVLVDQMCRYLAGDALVPEVNFLCGQPVQLAVPLAAASPPLTLQGPGLAAAEANLPAPDAGGRLSVPQAQVPGNFSVLDGKGGLAAGFSLNVRAEESDLTKVPKEAIEEVLGPGAVLQVGRGASLKEALQRLQPPPVELLPWLMMAVLLALAVEAALANRFYRRSEPAGEPAGAVP